MAFEANGYLFGKGIEVDAIIEDGTRFFTYCGTCKKTLYCATEENAVTRLVAQLVMEDHASFFAEEHLVLIISKPNL